MTPDRFRALKALINAINRPAMIIGGVAVSMRGRPRMTLDADVTLAADPGDLPAILDAAGACGFEPRPANPAEFVGSTRVLPLRHTSDGWEVDLIFAGTPYELEAVSRARMERLGETDLPVISAEDLLVHKILAGRPRDIEDAESIVLRQGARLDRATARATLLDLASFLADDDLKRRVEDLLPSVDQSTNQDG
ncbi:MAG: hypothetical protein PHU25_08130 [Deltaproteobacteria bacterium]|nr:hypothetical protein [Deltaproteobacteria bacterium]